MTLKEILEGAARAAEAGESGRAAMIIREQVIPRVEELENELAAAYLRASTAEDDASRLRWPDTTGQ